MKVTRLWVGALFCMTGALLYAINFMAAVLYAPNVTSWSGNGGKLGEAYRQIGQPLQPLAVVFLLVGILYLILAETSQDKPSETA